MDDPERRPAAPPVLRPLSGTAATPATLREHNERTVFEAVRTGHPISRAEIARRVGVSKPTASAALANLLRIGLVREVSAPAGSLTYGALFFEPVPEAAYILAVDIGARHVRGAIAALDGTVRAGADIDSAGLDVAGVVSEVAALRDRLARRAGATGSELELAVVGTPGVTDRDGRVHYALGSVPGLDGFDLAAHLGSALGLPVRVENDVNLAALGEQTGGVGRGVDDFAFLHIGTGTGAGLVLRGELHRGFHGAAGEIDFAVDGGWSGTAIGGPNDPCAPALAALADDMLAGWDGAPTTLSAPTSPESVFTAARAGDPLALVIAAEEARRIATYAAPIAAVADVELIVLGGGIGLNGDVLIEPLRAALSRLVPYPPRIERSALGDTAILDGAVTLAAQSARETVLNRRLGQIARSRVG